MAIVLFRDSGDEILNPIFWVNKNAKSYFLEATGKKVKPYFL